jgi:hypothetical protein
MTNIARITADNLRRERLFFASIHAIAAPIKIGENRMTAK